MKHLLAFILLCMSLFSFSQNEGVLEFRYDAAGNQIIRKYITINSKNSNVANEKDLTSTNEIVLLNSEFSGIKYYPNPVKEALYIEWNLEEGVFINVMQLVDFNGRIIKNIENLKTSKNTSVDFTDLPTGLYNVILIDSTNTTKVLKIIRN